MLNKYEKLFLNLNYLYFDNDITKHENVEIDIIKRHQPPLEEVGDVYYVVNYKEYSLHARLDSLVYLPMSIGDNNNTDHEIDIKFMEYVKTLCRKIKIEKVLE